MPRIELISPDESFTLGDADSSFTLRRLGTETAREIRRRHTRRIDPDRPGDYPRDETDEAEVERDQLDYIIQDWKGIAGPGGADAPCTRDNKSRLPQTVKIQILTAAHAVNTSGDLEAQLKNWPRPSGTPAPAGGSTAGA